MQRKVRAMLQIGKQLTPEQRLSKAVVDIMGKAHALSGILMIGDRAVEYDATKVPTACTDGKNEWYGAEFIDPLKDAQLRFLVLHESYHKLYRHLITWQHLRKIDAHLANISMDHDINIKIMDEFGADGWVEFIEGGCLNYDYRGWGTAKIFWHLHEEQKSNPDGSTPTLDGEPLDDHDWDGAEEMDAEEKRELEREIDEAHRQGATIAGKTGSGGGDCGVGDLLQPQVDWREKFRDFVQTTCAGNDMSTWRKPKRRLIGQGIYMPSTYSEQVGPLAVHLDMSGSISKRERTAMLTEVVSIAKMVNPPELHVLYWDTEVCRAEVYGGDELDTVLDNTKPEGGGGTDVRCVPDYLTEHKIKPQASVVFTDGYIFGGWGEWDHPVLWCVLDNENASPDIGKVIHIKSEDMR